jgi:hypothetical protein
MTKDLSRSTEDLLRNVTMGYLPTCEDLLDNISNPLLKYDGL